MAEVTAFRNNAMSYPIYAQPWTIVFPLLDADGDPITPSSPDSERSLNGDTFADCTNEAVEIATSTGVCYLILTAAEMTADIVAVRIQSTGAKTTVMTLYPRKLVVLASGTAAGGAAGSITLDVGAPEIDDYFNGCVVVGVLDAATEVRMITDYDGATQVATVTPNWVTTPDSNDTFTIYQPDGRQIVQANVTAVANGTGGVGDLLDNVAAVFDAIMALTQGVRTIGLTGNDTTHLNFSGLAYGDDEINNMLLLIYDASEQEWHSRWVDDWVLSTQLATVAVLPFTPEDSVDEFYLLGIRRDDATLAALALLATRTSVLMGTAQGDGTSTDTLQLTAGQVSGDDALNGRIVAIVAGAGAGQQRGILDSDQSDNEIRVDGGAWATPVDATSVYVIFGN